VIEAECVGCNLCVMICSAEEYITPVSLTDGVDPRRG
jgi:Fe-S-cluster-containing hydrogenase component 2